MKKTPIIGGLVALVLNACSSTPPRPEELMENLAPYAADYRTLETQGVPHWHNTVRDPETGEVAYESIAYDFDRDGLPDAVSAYRICETDDVVSRNVKPFIVFQAGNTPTVYIDRNADGVIEQAITDEALLEGVRPKDYLAACR